MCLLIISRLRTASRRLADSSPKISRPSQSITATPFTVRLLILSCTKASRNLPQKPIALGATLQVQKSRATAPAGPAGITYNRSFP